MAQAKYEIRRKCPICGAVFQIRTIDSVYCSKHCSDVAYKRKKDREAKEAKYEQLAKEIPDIREFLSVTVLQAMRRPSRQIPTCILSTVWYISAATSSRRSTRTPWWQSMA